MQKTPGRPRTITNAKLDSIAKMARKMGGSITKACNVQHKSYGSVVAAAHALKHPLTQLIKPYKARAKK